MISKTRQERSSMNWCSISNTTLDLQTGLRQKHSSSGEVNGRDDIQMWSRTYTLYNACDTAIGLELEEAFFANVGRKGRDVGSY
ncbi:hypothetical protein NP493_169g04025 [Ridgeia piscesae]|uniref:Uncharacterized protein n=1 Tax=Ridgeia piscesae TaxID=27915 RepID=A0AAD9UFE7_RIDPI|nr:hypothetical protein NP493_169g04025 [Ridgeia piscesae]